MEARRSLGSLVALALALALVGGASRAEADELRDKGISVAAVLERVRSASGEKMWASDTVADEKLVVLLDTKDAARARETLDLLPGYQWVTGVLPDNTQFYVLGPDWEERELWRKTSQSVEQTRTKLANGFASRRLQQYLDALKLSDSQLADLAGKDPNLVRELRLPQRRPLFVYLAGLRPDALDRLFAGDWIEVQLSGMPLQIQEATVAALSRSADRTLSYGDDSNVPAAEGPKLSLPQGGSLKIEGYGPDDGLVISLSVPKPTGVQTEVNFISGVARPRFYFAEGFDKQLLVDLGMPDAHAEESSKNDIAAYWREHDRVKARVLEERLKDRPPRFGDRKAPDVKLDQTVEGRSGYELLQGISKARGFALAAHYFERTGGLPVDLAVESGTPIGRGFDKAIDLLDMRRGCVWALRDGCVVATHVEFVDRLESEIPARVLAKWRDRAAKHSGVLTFDDLVEMSLDLTEKQWRMDTMPRDLFYTGACSAKYLRLYASLSPRLRKLAWNSGARYDRMNRAQKQAFEVDSATPERLRIERRKDREKFEEYAIIYSFANVSPLELSVLVKKSPAEPENADARPPVVAPVPEPIPVEPKPISVAAALARWTYAAYSESDSGEIRAIVKTRRQEEMKHRVLHTEDLLEGAKLTTIEPEHLVFTYGGTTIGLPARRAVALEPYDPEWIARGESWVDEFEAVMDY